MIGHSGGMDPRSAISGEPPAVTGDRLQVEISFPEAGIPEVHIVIARKNIDVTMRKLPEDCLKAVIGLPEKIFCPVRQFYIFSSIITKGVVIGGLSKVERNFIKGCLVACFDPVPFQKLLEFHETPGCFVAEECPGNQVPRENSNICFRPRQ